MVNGFDMTVSLEVYRQVRAYWTITRLNQLRPGLEIPINSFSKDTQNT